MKIVLFGAKGQLGLEIEAKALQAGCELIPLDLPELDITSKEQVSEVLQRERPELIINAAAYTAVDQAEQEKDQAYLVNCDGAANIALAARDAAARLIYLSTDYVFGEGHQEPIKEEADTSPLNVYGASKLAGERETLRICEKLALVVRISSLHGSKGNNFVHTMLKLFKSREEVSVVNDQYMSPTWAGWLAEILVELAGKEELSGIVHASSCGNISWYDFAAEILNVVKPQLNKDMRLEPISALQFPRAAKRASYSVLDTSKLTSWLGKEVIGWKEGLHSHLNELGY